MSEDTGNFIDLARGVEIARLIERTVAPLGYHVGISGSVLFAGESDNDVDLFLYKHDEMAQCRKADILAALASAGFGSQFQTDEKYVEKDVVVSMFRGARVDLFFMSGRRGL